MIGIGNDDNTINKSQTTNIFEVSLKTSKQTYSSYNLFKELVMNIILNWSVRLLNYTCSLHTYNDG